MPSEVCFYHLTLPPYLYLTLVIVEVIAGGERKLMVCGLVYSVQILTPSKNLHV